MTPLLQAMYYKTLTDIVTQYSYQLSQDGITEDSMTKTLDTVQEYLDSSNQDDSVRVSSLISEIHASLPSARQGVEQVFTGRDGSGE